MPLLHILGHVLLLGEMVMHTITKERVLQRMTTMDLWLTCAESQSFRRQSLESATCHLLEGVLLDDALYPSKLLNSVCATLSAIALPDSEPGGTLQRSDSS